MNQTRTTTIALDGLRTHLADVLSTAPPTVRTSSEQWAYAISFPIDVDESVAERLRLFVDVTVSSGRLGILLVGDDWQTLLAALPKELGVGRHLVEIVRERTDLGNLVFRNNTAADKECVFTVHGIEAEPQPQSTGPEAAINQRAPILEVAAPSGLALESDERVLALLRERWGVVPAGLSNRRSSAELATLDDEELRSLWTAAYEQTTMGAGYAARGWYHTLYCDVLRGKRVLEIGSGMGIDGIAFGRAGARMTFVDIVSDNLRLIERFCKIFGVADARFLHLDRLSALDRLPTDFEIVWCQGSLINAPFAFMRRECAKILEHLPPGGRWLELAYPRERWMRDGGPPFSIWGNMTDGEGTPWMEWYDLARVRERLQPAEFEVVLSFNFHDDDFNWFDLRRVR